MFKILMSGLVFILAHQAQAGEIFPGAKMIMEQHKGDYSGYAPAGLKAAEVKLSVEADSLKISFFEPAAKGPKTRSLLEEGDAMLLTIDEFAAQVMIRQQGEKALQSIREKNYDKAHTLILVGAGAGAGIFQFQNSDSLKKVLIDEKSGYGHDKSFSLVDANDEQALKALNAEIKVPIQMMDGTIKGQ